MTKILFGVLAVFMGLGVLVEDNKDRRDAYVKCFIASSVILALMS